MTEIDGEFPDAAPVHLSKRYSADGVAVIDICVPSSTIPPLGLIAPPSLGLATVVKVYFIGGGGGSSLPDEQELISEIPNKSKKIFFIVINL
jgi:hypothetical protein